MEPSSQHLPLPLNGQTVHNLLLTCLAKSTDAKNKSVVIRGVRMKFNFSTEQIRIHKPEIKELIDQLPTVFSDQVQNGGSFLYACQNRHGEQWGDQLGVEMLLCLGLAADLLEYCASRKVWKMFPGGMPFFRVKRVQLITEL